MVIPMKIYQKYLVCYDIEDNKTRTKFFNQLKDIGLIPLQKSVFWGDLSQAEFNALKRTAFELLDKETDKVFWVKTQLDVAQLKAGLGYQYFSAVEVDGYATV